MIKEDYDKIINELRTTDDAGRRSELLQNLDNDYSEMLANETELNNKITKITNENETLRKANNSLWLERSVNNDNNNDNNVNNNDNNDNNHAEKIDINNLDFD